MKTGHFESKRYKVTFSVLCETQHKLNLVQRNRALLALRACSFFGLSGFVLRVDLPIAVNQHSNHPQLQNYDQHVHHDLRDHSRQLRVFWGSNTFRYSDYMMKCKCVTCKKGLKWISPFSTTVSSTSLLITTCSSYRGRYSVRWKVQR